MKAPPPVSADRRAGRRIQLDDVRTMNILFVHQNFPGQYREMFRWLVARKTHRIVALTQRRDLTPVDGARIVPYAPHHRAADGAYALSSYWEDCVGAGYGVARAGAALKAEGFQPDLILGHVGWGELTFTRQVWPDVPVIGYFEYFFLAEGGSVGFDPEFPARPETPFAMHARNAVHFSNLHTVDLGQVPTRWQRDTFPEAFHRKLHVCHDGIRTDLLRPAPDAQVRLERLDRPLTREDEVLTYVARNMEPTRGFHVFMRALPEILDARPGARALIVGGNEVSYGRKSDEPGGYRAMMEREVGERIDWSRVHFLGRVPYRAFLDVLRISRCHVYLTAPFVPSWSLLEAMALGTTIVASDVAPVREVSGNGAAALLVPYPDAAALARQVVDVLRTPARYRDLGHAARAHVRDHYDFRTRTLPVHLERMNALLPTDRRIAAP